MRGDNILKALFDQNCGLRVPWRRIGTVKEILRRVSEFTNEVTKEVQSLNLAIEERSWDDITDAIALLAKCLVAQNIPSNRDPSLTQPPKPKIQECETFVIVGGFDAILKLLSRTFIAGFSRPLKQLLSQNSQTWNDVLYVFREVIFAAPALANTSVNRDHVLFIFSMLCESSVFEGAVSVLEELLSLRSETFSLDLIPNLYQLIGGLTSRQLAHFCRVLSLVLFEPEDRQILEGAHILRSIELLQLRRDRMSRHNNAVERNQSLMIEMPHLLERLITILRVGNYGPKLSDRTHHMIAHMYNYPVEMWESVSRLGDPRNPSSEWAAIDRLDQLIVEADKKKREAASPMASKKAAVLELTSTPYTISGTSTDAVVQPSAQVSTTASTAITTGNRANSDSNLPDDGEDFNDFLNRLLRQQDATTGGGEDEFANMAGLFMIAQHLGVAPFGQVSNGGQRNRVTMDPGIARNKLAFHAMLLAPHQVELLFVLCTLLSGRRKLDVQRRLARHGMPSVILNMYDRLSWEAPPFTGPNPLEHIHGPGCECNPESALRVQFLRLVHNFYDRDFVGMDLKRLIMSNEEMKLILDPPHRWMIPIELETDARGLVTKMAQTFQQKPQLDSIYRFWLSSCLETFLRGSPSGAQALVARTGVLKCILNDILQPSNNLNSHGGMSSDTQLQTFFDLLGEMLKCNPTILRLLDTTLSELDVFETFMRIVFSNVVDSNVFLRSLFITLQNVSDESQLQLKSSKDEEPGYLTHSWVLFAPSPVLNGQHHTQARSQHQQHRSGTTIPMRTSASSSFLCDGPAQLTASLSTVSLLSRPQPKQPTRAKSESALSSFLRIDEDISTKSAENSNNNNSTISSNSGLFSGLRHAAAQFLLRGAAAQTQPQNEPQPVVDPVLPITPQVPVADTLPPLPLSVVTAGPRRMNAPTATLTALLTREASSQPHSHGEVTLSSKSLSLEDDELDFVTPPEQPRYSSATPGNASSSPFIQIPLIRSLQPSTYSPRQPSLILRKQINDADALLQQDCLHQRHSRNLDQFSSATESGILGPLPMHVYEASNSDGVSLRLSQQSPQLDRLQSDSPRVDSPWGRYESPNLEQLHYKNLYKPQQSPDFGFIDTSYDSDNSDQFNVAGESNVEEAVATTQQKIVTWDLPPELHRLGDFLTARREGLLLRLITAVNLHSVNHENICCVNTALLILLFSNRRGDLKDLLRRLRLLAGRVGVRQRYGQLVGPILGEWDDPCVGTFAEPRVCDEDEDDDYGANESYDDDLFDWELEDDNDHFKLIKERESSVGKDRATAPEYKSELHDTPMSSVYTHSSQTVTHTDFSVPVNATFISPTMAISPTNTHSARACMCLQNCGECTFVNPRSGVSVAVVPVTTPQSCTSRSALHSTTQGVGMQSLKTISAPPTTGSAITALGAAVPSPRAAQDSHKAITLRRSLKRKLRECSDRVMRNFRELLWFWREYYLRRGRDRLSIEFSSRVPFAQWKALVDQLCADDGGFYSLLDRALIPPRSPYLVPPRISVGCLNDIFNYQRTEAINAICRN